MSTDEDMTRLIVILESKLGRLPTEDEVVDFIFGDDAKRAEILAIDKAE